jgi:hypothetical protein
MPRYFFHLRFGQRVVRDEEGIELPNRSAARDEAVAVVYIWPIPRRAAIRGAGRAHGFPSRNAFPHRIWKIETKSRVIR